MEELKNLEEMEELEKGEKEEGKRQYYAQLNEEGICFSILDTPAELPPTDSIVQMPTYDSSVLGKKYENGVWTEIPEKEEFSETDILQAQSLLNQQKIMIRQEEMEKVLAEILLNQQRI